MSLLDTFSSTLARLTGRRPRQQLGFEPRPHYYYLASFPKSGNTWVRFLLANIIAEQEIGLRGFGRFVPDSHLKGDLAYMADADSPFNQAPRQFVKTHYRYQPEFQNAIYVVRDGRDALTSYYHWINARRATPISLRDIITGNTVWGLWSDHVMGWLRGRCNRLMVKYEDLYADTAGELRRILDFARISATDDQIAGAVKAASFESMREKERELKGDGPAAPPAADAAASPDGKVMFVRKGGSGDWRNLFSPEEEALFWRHHRTGMEAAGYAE